ncbi:hypothetical protein JCM3774_004380 [Rhodotorula dairenensis]
MSLSPDPTLAEHEVTRGASKHLETAFEHYRAADPQKDAYVVTASTAVFDPLVASPSAVAWPLVFKALVRHFGTTDQSRREAVDPGRLGFARVMDVLRKTVGFAHDPASAEAAEIMLARLQRAVEDRTAALAKALAAPAVAAKGVEAGPLRPTNPAPVTLSSHGLAAAAEKEPTPQLPTPPTTNVENGSESASSKSYDAVGQSSTLAPSTVQSSSARDSNNVKSVNASVANGQAFLDDEKLFRLPKRDRATAPSTEPTPKQDRDDPKHHTAFSEAGNGPDSQSGSDQRRKSRKAAASSKTQPAVSSDFGSDSPGDSDFLPRITRRQNRQTARPNYRGIISSGDEAERAESTEDTDDDDLYAGPEASSRRRPPGIRKDVDTTSMDSSSEDEATTVTQAFPTPNPGLRTMPDKRKQPVESPEASEARKRPRTDADTTNTGGRTDAAAGADATWSSSGSGPTLTRRPTASTALVAAVSRTLPATIAGGNSPVTVQATVAPGSRPFVAASGAAATQPQSTAPAGPAAAPSAASPPRPVEPRSDVRQSTARGGRIASLFPMAQLPELACAWDMRNTPSNRFFTRAQMGGGQQGAINMGSSGEPVRRPGSTEFKKTGPTIYDSSCDHLSPRAENNVCLPDVATFGEPIVLLSDEGKLVKYKDALSANRTVKKGDSKLRRGSHVFVSNWSSQWAYRGIHDVAYDGTRARAWQLPHGPGASSRIDPYLKRLIESRLKRKAPGKDYPQLRAWGWRLRCITDRTKQTGKGAKPIKVTPTQLWQELDSGKIKVVIPFLVLRCVGFDQADFDVWEEARAAAPM